NGDHLWIRNRNWDFAPHRSLGVSPNFRDPGNVCIWSDSSPTRTQGGNLPLSMHLHGDLYSWVLYAGGVAFLGLGGLGRDRPGRLPGTESFAVLGHDSQAQIR